MNKKILIIVGLLLVGILAFFLTRKSSNEDASKPSSVSEVVNESMEFGKAIESGKPTKCTLTKGSDTIFYKIKGKMMLATTITSSTDPETKKATTTSNMLNDGQYIYFWSDSMPQGTKMPIPDEKEIAAQKESIKEYSSNTPTLSNQQDFNSLKDAGYSINCVSENINDSDFVPPVSIKFQDLSTIMQPPVTKDGETTIDIKKLQEQYGSMGEAN